VNRHWFWLPGVLLLAAPAVLAADLSELDYSVQARDRYDRCVELTKRKAGTAIDQAAAWYKAGGGAAALHCESLGLVALRRYTEAADALAQAAHEGAVGSAPERAALMDQAGNAWLLAGKPEKADESFSAALAFAPQDEDVLADRARARGLRKDWAGAEADLSAVLSLDPNRADALVLRASALHAEGRKADARADIEHALEVDPDYPEALLERGNMKFEGGDAAGARADWQQVVGDAPGTDAASTAEARLQMLAVKPPKR